MLATAEYVSHVPIIRASRRRCVFTALDVLRICESVAAARVRADRCTADDANARRNILPAPAADLVADDAADCAAYDGAWHIHAGTLIDNGGLDPAKLLRRANYRPHVRDFRLIQPFVVATTVFGQSRRIDIGSSRRCDARCLVCLALSRGSIQLSIFCLPAGELGTGLRVVRATLRRKRRLLATCASNLQRKRCALVRESGQLMNVRRIPAARDEVIRLTHRIGCLRELHGRISHDLRTAASSVERKSRVFHHWIVGKNRRAPCNRERRGDRNRTQIVSWHFFSSEESLSSKNEDRWENTFFAEPYRVARLVKI